MKSASLQSRKETLLADLQACRIGTLNLVADLDRDTLCRQAHPEFSPIGWHLGHIAFTEALWILQHLANLAPQFREYQRLFAADGLPKAHRQDLPSQDFLLTYLATIREQVLAYLRQIAPDQLQSQERLWHWLIQHESQHNETIAFILQLHRWRSPYLSFSQPETLTGVAFPKMVEIPAGEILLGSNDLCAQDNERPAYPVYVPRFWLDRYPVTCAQYRDFTAAGGYQRRDWWSEAGWQWLQLNPVSQPLYWSNSPDWDNHPVCGVSWYEADAYARHLGKRLPTEAEWEKAASCHPHKGKQTYPWGEMPPSPKLCNYNTLVGHTTPVNAYPLGQSASGCYDLLGNVWEWTASDFVHYPDFQSYPYQGYSQTYFDRQHRVLRGGSWATRPWGLRASFRNWYHPWVRQILAGFRCAKDVSDSKRTNSAMEQSSD
ncbi:MAG: ergothioneine biosynthesis protein EgtB [Chloroflexaceae bacterium]|nr:ergothioneine biosynthesis protein EgtB [Chloroflexaceae bacterium]